MDGQILTLPTPKEKPKLRRPRREVFAGPAEQGRCEEALLDVLRRAHPHALTGADLHAVLVLEHAIKMDRALADGILSGQVTAALRPGFPAGAAPTEDDFSFQARGIDRDGAAV